MPYFVYIVECRDGSFYTGYSLDIQRRLEEHNKGKRGAKSIRGKLPVTLAYSEALETLSEALKRENEIKGWSHREKQEFIQGVKLRVGQSKMRE